MLNIGVCDDNKQALLNIYETLLSLNVINNWASNIVAFDDPYELSRSLNDFDMLFLDIEMPYLSGMQIAMRAYMEKLPLKIVFTSNYSKYMKAAFKVNAYRFLEKPIAAEDAAEAIQSTLLELSTCTGILINDVNSKESIFVRFSEILYIQSLGDHSAIKTHQRLVFSTRTLKEWDQILPPKLFMACHRSYRVAVAKIASYNSSEIFLRTNESVPLSGRQERNLKRAITDYLLV